MVKVNCNPEIFDWAIRRGRFSVVELKEKFPLLEKWLNHTDRPTLRQLEKLADFLRIPFGLFFLNEPPREESLFPFFRTKAEPIHMSLELLDTIASVKRKQDWIHDNLAFLNIKPLDFVGSVKEQDNPREVAKKIRAALSLTENWASRCKTWEESFNFLIEKIEELGIFVIINGVVANNTHRTLNVEEFRGFVLVSQYAPFIFVNGQDAKAAQMFTLAHELAHVWVGKSAGFDLREMLPAEDTLEKFCDKVASETLVPEEEFLLKWKALKKRNALRELARDFKVSEIVIARKALDANCITLKEFLQFYKAYIQKSKTKTSRGGNFYANQVRKVSKRFAQIVNIAAKQELLLYREAYKLTGLHGITYENFMRRIEKI
ncbi:MAG: ImmA/IrrE family metallo-endopeptidase [Leptospiraceae bacterium]|nr:ImmA/IrrE family metallo-endopeptidase [Leptospiraceae bacterium]